MQTEHRRKDSEDTFQERSSRTPRTEENIHMLWLEVLNV